jgi:hypothetical protein
MTLDEEEFIFHYELGQCMNEWAWIERNLGQVALSCFPKAQHKAIMDGYFSIENFRSKIAFVDSIVQRKRDDANVLKRWNDVLDRARTASTTRNALVHRTLVIYERGKGGRRVALMKWMAFMDEKWDKARNPKGEAPPEAICLVQLGAFQNTCQAITRTLFNVTREVAGKPALLPAAFEQEFDRMTARDIERRFRVRLGRQPRPSK